MVLKLAVFALPAFLVPQLAAAADMPVKAPPPAPAVVASQWSGFYIGGQVGVAWIRDRFTESNSPLIPPQTGHANLRDTGILGGGHVGFNWQRDRVVFGVEADFEGTSLNSTSTCLIQDAGVGNAAPGACFITPHSFGAKIPWQGSIRGRLGYTFGNSLVYATGGGAFARIETTFTQTGFAPQSFSVTKSGWTVGGGLEHMFSPNWTGRVEYRYANFGTVSNAITSAGPFWNGYTGQHKIEEHTVRVGISYLFQRPLVVARY